MPLPPNFITTSNPVGPTNPIDVNLNEDNAVCGFANLIPVPQAKQMIVDYFKDFDDIEKLIDILNTDPRGGFIKTHSGFIALAALFDPNRHTVSGVFGKEVILQILSQKKCEGLRYFIGKHQNKPTVILAGVKNEEKDITLSDGTMAIQLNTGVSEMLPDASTFLAISPLSAHDSSNPPIGEVHTESKTVQEVRNMVIPAHLQDENLVTELTIPANKVFLSF